MCEQYSRIACEVIIMYEDNSAVMDIELYDDDTEKIPNETTLMAMTEREPHRANVPNTQETASSQKILSKIVSVSNVPAKKTIT